jgi:holo-[acyl-carrier protein] synthase
MLRRESRERYGSYQLSAIGYQPGETEDEMIVGIGMDLVSVERIAALLERRGERALRRLFAPGEVAYCRARGRPAVSFAARFAAKEAFFKALGTGWSGGMAWWEVEVVSAESGAPALRLSGLAAQEAEARGARRYHLSLTHTDDLAGAYVILES